MFGFVTLYTYIIYLWSRTFSVRTSHMNGPPPLQAAIKSFETMIKYCEGTFCRHSVFSKHFGDAPPECKKRCDTCKDVKAVEKKTVAFAGIAAGGRGGFRGAIQ